MRRRLLLLALGLSLAVPAGAAVTQLKVMSFNIWVNGGLSLSNCIEAIRGAGADIVGLQECNAATAQTIATRLGISENTVGNHFRGIYERLGISKRSQLIAALK